MLDLPPDATRDQLLAAMKDIIVGKPAIGPIPSIVAFGAEHRDPRNRTLRGTHRVKTRAKSIGTEVALATASMLMQDLRHTFRGWRRTPVLALTAIATLSLGVGANAAVFSVVHAVLFRPLPYPAPERLIELFEANPGTVGATTRASALNYLTWSARTKTFEALATFQGNDFNVTGGSDVERIPGSSVTASLFRVSGRGAHRRTRTAGGG